MIVRRGQLTDCGAQKRETHLCGCDSGDVPHPFDYCWLHQWERWHRAFTLHQKWALLASELCSQALVPFLPFPPPPTNLFFRLFNSYLSCSPYRSHWPVRRPLRGYNEVGTWTQMWAGYAWVKPWYPLKHCHIPLDKEELPQVLPLKITLTACPFPQVPLSACVARTLHSRACTQGVIGFHSCLISEYEA